MNMATITAASPGLADVREAVASASVADRVVIPAGSAVWSGQLVVTKGVVIVGAGATETSIKSAYAGGSGWGDESFMVVYKPSNHLDPFRLSGIKWDCDERHGWLKINNMSATAIPRRIRIDHNRVDNTAAFLFLLYGHAYGVMDGNDFNDGYFRFLGANASAWTNLSFEPGTADNWYIEGSTIEQCPHYGMVMYAEGGARYCIRDCEIGASVGDFYPLMDAHGNQPNAHHATMGVEIYRNRVSAGSLGGGLLDLRGGIGIVFENDIRSTGSIIPCKVREEYLDSGNAPATGPTGQPQHVSGSYFWGNTKNGTTAIGAYTSGTVDYGGSVGLVPKEGRDYFQTQKPGYTPLEYPHPLTHDPDVGDGDEDDEEVTMKKTIPFSLEVTAAPGFFLGIDPATLAVAQGAVAVYNVMVTGAGGFVGPVTLAVLGLPPLVSASFSKPSVNVGEVSALTLTVAAGAVMGTYQMEIEGTATV